MKLIPFPEDWPPGLIVREFFTDDGKRYIREEWDLTVPGCPMVAIDHSKWGSGGSVRDDRVKAVTRIVRVA